jgi:hypothetical protein
MDERLHEEVGAALREPNFLSLLAMSSEAHREAVVQQQLDRRRVGVRVTAVVKTPLQAGGHFRVDWMPANDAGGSERHNWIVLPD